MTTHLKFTDVYDRAVSLEVTEHGATLWAGSTNVIKGSAINLDMRMVGALIATLRLADVEPATLPAAFTARGFLDGPLIMARGEMSAIAARGELGIVVRQSSSASDSRVWIFQKDLSNDERDPNEPNVELDRAALSTLCACLVAQRSLVERVHETV
jgi:hypothetical protein